jgi:hypothetical protein
MDVEQTLARLLAQTIAGDCWEALASDPKDQASRDAMAARALRLYHEITPASEAWLDDETDAIEAALMPLRALADSYAILSRPWSDEERRRLPVIPTRGAIEWMIRSFDVDEWAANLGSPLHLTGASAIFEEPPHNEPQGPYAPGEAEETLASMFMSAMNGFKTIHDLWQLYDTEIPGLDSINKEEIPGLPASATGRDLLRSDPVRDAACREIAAARGNIVWTRTYVGLEAEAVAIAQFWTAQGCFVATHERRNDSPLFPSFEFLRALIDVTNAREWLDDHNAELPEWLVDED